MLFVAEHIFITIEILRVDGGQNRRNSQGKDLGGFKGYLEGIGGNPSLIEIQGKNIEKPKNIWEKPKKN